MHYQKVLGEFGIGIQNIAWLHMIIDHFKLSLVKTIFFIPVIGQVARDERIEAFLKIVTVSNLYFTFFTHKTSDTGDFMKKVPTATCALRDR